MNDQSIDINKGNNQDATPFYISCQNGHIEIVKLLLNDQRVEINKANRYDKIPFHVACENGHIEIVKLLLASEREVNLNPKYLPAIDIAREKEKRMLKICPNIVELIELFEGNPNKTRFELRIQLGLIGKILFSLFFYFID